MHRIRHRGRIESVTSRLRKFAAHQAEALAQMNAIIGVAGVTATEVVASIVNNATINPVGVRDIRASYQRGTTLVVEVEALGIPIA
jgi:hypothetical protein